MAAGALTAGTLLGFGVGYTVAVARRAWTDYHTTRAAIPKLRRTAWHATTKATIRGAAVTLVLLAAAWLAWQGPH